MKTIEINLQFLFILNSLTSFAKFNLQVYLLNWSHWCSCLIHTSTQEIVDLLQQKVFDFACLRMHLTGKIWNFDKSKSTMKSWSPTKANTLIFQPNSKGGHSQFLWYLYFTSLLHEVMLIFSPYIFLGRIKFDHVTLLWKEPYNWATSIVQNPWTHIL